MDGVLLYGGNMRKIFITAAIMLCLLTGCSSRNAEVVLTDVALEEAADRTDGSGKEISEEPGDSALVENPEDLPGPEEEKSPAEPEKIAVFICGAVNLPGVYELPETSRINDAIEAAGGFSKDADRTYINLAARITDGMKLKVPTLDEALLLSDGGNSDESGFSSFDKGLTGGADSSFNGAEASGAGLVNINTATAEQLKTLPGVGDGIAGRIIKYREENGAFKTKEDIMKVSGIKDKLFSRIKDTITV